MDENFLLYKDRAMELLDQMKAKGKAWQLYVFSSANALSKYTMRELVELGIAWVWMGLEAPQSQYSKLKGADTLALTKELQSHGIGVLGSTIVGLEHHTPENIAREIEHAVSHDTDFHQFMLYTPVPGTPLYQEMVDEGRLLPDVDLADIHGQDHFNFQHAAIPARAVEDAARLGVPARLREERPQRLPAGPDDDGRLAAVSQRSGPARPRPGAGGTATTCGTGYGAALFAMEKYLKKSNVEVSEKIRDFRKQMERELGHFTRWVDRVAGPVVLWTARRDARKFPRGKRIEPMTFLERRNWPEGQEA